MPKPLLFPIKKLVPLTAELAKRIADFRFANRISSENEAVRRLIERGLARTTGAKEEPHGN